ncbi:hypothetical protein [Arenibacterium halophilum]|uniref:Uncharacterized protein n=1 Tax=Arenibacterium halophilum TaxID=2583821 RepID=A0ABY2X7I2_9RHOB|nr:hypothetical protein [Arenibacterium halophilum]TMV11753.1 hypothetical protein FGK64_15940 [Arenibacterium halophilum]
MHVEITQEDTTEQDDIAREKIFRQKSCVFADMDDRNQVSQGDPRHIPTRCRQDLTKGFDARFRISFRAIMLRLQNSLAKASAIS